jgi:hypothetical protein
MLFELRDLRRKRGLGNVETARGLPEMQGLAEGLEIAELAEREYADQIN